MNVYFKNDPTKFRFRKMHRVLNLMSNSEKIPGLPPLLKSSLARRDQVGNKRLNSRCKKLRENFILIRNKTNRS